MVMCKLVYCYLRPPFSKHLFSELSEPNCSVRCYFSAGEGGNGKATDEECRQAEAETPVFRTRGGKSAGELSLCVLEGTVADTRYHGAARMSWINSLLEWSDKT